MSDFQLQVTSKVQPHENIFNGNPRNPLQHSVPRGEAHLSLSFFRPGTLANFLVRSSPGTLPNTTAATLISESLCYDKGTFFTVTEAVSASPVDGEC